MAYVVNGVELATDDQGYLIEPDYREEAAPVIAAAEGISLTDAHWEVIGFLREEYKAQGHTPNFRGMLKASKQSVRVSTASICMTSFPRGRRSRAPRLPACRSPSARAVTDRTE